MLGSFQKARGLLRSSVARLQGDNEELERRLREEGEHVLDSQIADLHRKCAEARRSNAERQRRLDAAEQGHRRDSEAVARLRASWLALREELQAARGEAAQEAEREAAQLAAAAAAEGELERALRAEEALQDMLRFLWQLMEDLASQVSLEPPWRCGLCSCSNPQESSACGVCDIARGDEAGAERDTVVEAYFEFRLHQEFLGRCPAPPAEKQLPALRIALSHRTEGWIQSDEVDELQERCKELAADASVEPALQAEAAYVLFTLGREDGSRIGRALLKSMGENGTAVRQMCRQLRQRHVALQYQRMLQLKKHDLHHFDDWLEKFQQAQARVRAAARDLQRVHISAPPARRRRRARYACFE
ncbi:unnamed protein product [Prorocentrum cordatum]|uniref:RanBP2-type domain-containing protein n=1 Tax=Prorocentrum cordatum TaxID=2364126 RepID=A0ABN9Y0C7_9DINO|nr:unnamed protein product [Polarella glacialis]